MFKRKTSGSIVLEAALVLPLFIAFVILLITFVRIAMVEIALENTVSEATKQIAAHMYPIDLMYGELSSTNTGTKISDGIDKVEEGREKAKEIEDLLSKYEEQLPQELRSLLSVRQSFEGEASGLYNRALNTAFQPIVDYYADTNILSLANLQVTKVQLPDFYHRDNLYFGIEVRYDIPLNLPFFNSVVTLRESSYERVWIGDGSVNLIENGSNNNSGNNSDEDKTSADEDGQDNGEDNADNKNEENEEEKLVIESLNSPLQRGHYQRIYARGPPNETAYIEIRYQSGFVKSKTCSFDENGWLKCDIIIGGHSNEGTYEVIIRTGKQEVNEYFEVLSKANMEKYNEERKAASIFNN